MVHQKERVFPCFCISKVEAFQGKLRGCVWTDYPRFFGDNVNKEWDISSLTEFLCGRRIKNDPGCLGSWPGVSLWSRMEMTHSNCEWINGWKPGGRTQEGPGSTDGWRSNSTSTHANSALAPYKLLPDYRSPLKKERDPSTALRLNLQ